MESTLIHSLESISSDVLNGANYNNRDFARKILNYPAMMVPSVQESIIKALINVLPENASMIDPFMGASNTLVTSMRYGANVFGQDINPLAILISQVKTHIYSEGIKASFDKLVERLDNKSSKKVDVQFRNIDKWFKKDVQIELSNIRKAILEEGNQFYRKLFWVTLAEVIRLTSNDRTSTFKMHMRPLEEIERRNLSPKEIFKKIGERNVEDILSVKLELEKKDFIKDNNYIFDVDIAWGDSKEKINTEKKYNLLVTSPPYGDNHTTVTYGQFSYLPLQWIPIKDIDECVTMNYLDVIQEIDSCSLGGKNLKEYSVIEESLFTKSKTLKRFFEKFSEEEQIKAKKVLSFINDLNITLDNILEKMNPGSYMVWTIGNRNVNNKEVKNDDILTELLSSKKVDLITDLDRDILSKRMPGRNNFSSTMSKEKILIFKTPVVNE